MSLLTFIQSLPNVIERRDLVNVLDQLADEYDDTLGPIVADVGELFQGVPTKSNLAAKMDNTMRRYVNYNGNSLPLILNTLTNMRANFEQVRREIRATFSVTFTNTNLSFDKANVLKFIEAVAFYITYARKYLMFLVAAEAMKEGKATSPKWTPDEQAFIDSNMDQFAGLYTAMSQSVEQFKARMKQTSNAQIEESTFQIAVQQLAMNKVDPLQMDGFSPRSNPLMLFGKFLAEMQHLRYKRAQEEYYCLQLRLQELRDIRNQEGASPIIGKQITQYEKRISDFEYEMYQVRRKAGLES